MNTYTPNRVKRLRGVSRRRNVAASEPACIGAMSGSRRLGADVGVSLLREQLGTAPVKG